MSTLLTVNHDQTLFAIVPNDCEAVLPLTAVIAVGHIRVQLNAIVKLNEAIQQILSPLHCFQLPLADEVMSQRVHEVLILSGVIVRDDNNRQESINYMLMMVVIGLLVLNQ